MNESKTLGHYYVNRNNFLKRFVRKKMNAIIEITLFNTFIFEKRTKTLRILNGIKTDQSTRDVEKPHHKLWISL